MEEAFFQPCTRMHDSMRAWNVEHENDVDVDENEHYLLPEDTDFEEVELRAGAGNGAYDLFHHPDFTFDEFWRLTQRKIVWMGPETFVESLDALATDEDVLAAVLDFRVLFGYETMFSVTPATSLDTDGDDGLQVYSSSVTDATTTVCDYVFQLMTRSNTIWTHLQINILPSVSTHILSQFLSNSRSTGGTISFDLDYLSDSLQEHLRDYLRALEVSTGPNHRIELHHNTNWSQLITATLANYIQRCHCAIVLRFRTYPVPSLIIDTLRGDCNIVEFHVQLVHEIDGLVRALSENKSLVRLTFVDVRISDSSWAVLCQSLSSHPKLEYLKLVRTFPCEVPGQHSNERLTHRTDMFLKMLQTNTVLEELNAPRYARDPRFNEFDERILVDVIQPYFRRLRHVRTFGNYHGPLYAQVLARALYKVDNSPALVWMLIRNNMPIVLEFEEDN
jgi:hypothetical protein